MSERERVGPTGDVTHLKLGDGLDRIFKSLFCSLNGALGFLARRSLLFKARELLLHPMHFSVHLGLFGLVVVVLLLCLLKLSPSGLKVPVKLT